MILVYDLKNTKQQLSHGPNTTLNKLQQDNEKLRNWIRNNK